MKASFRLIASPLIAPLLIVLAFGSAATCQTSTDEPDYSAELPRIPPLSTAEAQNCFALEDGFQIDLVASEPLVVDPIAFAFDERSRLFVVEMRGYSEDAEQNLGRIRMLIDDDGDGHYDRATTYVDGLSWPTAIACYDGGVFVGVAPEIRYYKDTDGDGRADQRRIVYEGFGRSNVQGLMNTFKWGLDNRIHGATSSSGANVRRTGSGKSDRLELRGRDFAFDPRSGHIEATSGGGQHGLSFSVWGDKFVCSNSDHVQFVYYEDRYVKRNPFFAPPPARRSIATDGPQADVFRSSPVEPWRIVRTRLRVGGLVPGPIEGGGTAAGYFTGATGLTIYRGSAWPSKFSGWAFVCDVGSNLIHRKRFSSNGVGYQASRVDDKSEFVRSSDIWFRPVQLGNGPDGTLYVADMYREVIEHPKSLPPVIKRHLDLTSGRDRGRIYRILPPNFQRQAAVDLSTFSPEALVAVLDHANGWHRETAARLLFERQPATAVVHLDKLVAGGKRPEARLRSLYLLDALKHLSADTLLIALNDPHPQVRRHAIRLTESQAIDVPAIRAKLLSMIVDESIHVRYQLAFSLGELSTPDRFSALARLAREAEDGYILAAVQSSLIQGAGVVIGELIKDATWCETNAGKGLLGSLAGQIGRQQDTSDVAAVVELAPRLLPEHPALLARILGHLNPRPGTPLAKQMSEGSLARIVTRTIAEARRIASDSSVDDTQRIPAIEAMGGLAALGARTLEDDQIFVELLSAQQALPVQEAALRSLTASPDDDVADVLVEQWGQLGPQIRRLATDRLLSRHPWQAKLLEAIQTQQVSIADVDVERWKTVVSDQLEAEFNQLVATPVAHDRQQVFAEYRSIISQPGEAKRGQAIFTEHCASCHQLGTLGYAVGPNLSAMRNRGAEAILMNVLAPNQEVNPQYVTYVATTDDGQVFSGLITDESATSITLSREKNQAETILRVNLDELTSTGKSLMPEGFERQIDRQAMTDLLTFILEVNDKPLERQP